jgi:hypothetical protein
MRALLVLVMVTLGRVAHADMVDIQDPPIVSACPHAATWPLVLACIEHHGLAATVVGTLDDASLLALTTHDKAAAFQGFVLYVHAGAAWRIGGLTQYGGAFADYAILRLEHVRKRGYRFDLALAQPSSATLDNVTSVSMFDHQVVSAFCNGTSYACIQIVEKCEQIVHGQTISAFDGTIVVHDTHLELTGAGTANACSAIGDYRF